MLTVGIHLGLRINEYTQTDRAVHIALDGWPFALIATDIRFTNGMRTTSSVPDAEIELVVVTFRFQQIGERNQQITLARTMMYFVLLQLPLHSPYALLGWSIQ